MRASSSPDEVGEYFSAAISLINNWAPGLFFGAKDNTSFIVGVDRPTRKIRLSLRAELPLHIPRLEVCRRGTPVPVHPLRVRASSHYDHGGRDREELDLLRATDMLSVAPIAGMHTETEVNPWIEVDLGEVMTDISIRIWNRSDDWDWRNWSLVVSSSVDGLKWNTCYDHLELACNVEKLLVNAGINAGRTDVTGIYAFVQEACFSFFRSGRVDMGKLSVLAQKFGLPWHSSIGLLNDLFFRRFEKELGNHGLTRTFRFWSEDQKRIYLHATKRVMDALRQYSPHVCLGFGGACLMFVEES